MPRDYKHQKRQATGVPRSGMGFVAGLTLGLTVALGVFIYDRRVPSAATARAPEQPQSTPRPTTPTPRPRAAKSAPPQDASPRPPRNQAQNQSQSQAQDPAQDQALSQAKSQQFDFYEMLPKFEVVIPEQDESAPVQSRGAPLQKAGVYMLQAGSFRNPADAERVRALIALQGVQSKVQRVSIDRDTWHRVRIGPITDLRKLEDTRDKLRQAQVEALVIRVGG